MIFDTLVIPVKIIRDTMIILKLLVGLQTYQKKERLT